MMGFPRAAQAQLTSSETDRLRQEITEARKSQRSDGRLAIIVAVIGGLGLMGGQLVAGLVAQSSGPAISCSDERRKALELTVAHPKTWVPLDADDPIEKLCKVNAVVGKVAAEN